MKNALNTNKTVANHYLNPINRFWAKPLMILSILLTAMFILAACGGGAAAPAGVTPTTNPCVGNPFGSTCNSPADQARRATVVRTCLEAGAANTAVCAQAIAAEPCIVNPLAAGCAADAEFIAYLPTGTTVADVVNTRATYCNGQTTTPDDICDGVIAACDAANPFANAACGKVSNINALRTTYCTNAATTWNDNCDVEATYTGAKDARDTACLAFGTNAGGDADCHDRLALLAACPVTDPFAEPGCASADGIDGLRTTYCTTGNTIFDLECGALDVDTAEIITGTHAARNAACEASGTGAGDDNDCATRANIVATCTEASPFTNTGCDTATHITPEFRTAFCVKTDENDGKNPFTTGCPSSPLLDPALKTARDTACAENGITADATCATRQNIVDTCTATDPFANTGCNTATHILAGNNAIRTEFCTNGVNIFHPMCVETTHGAVNAARANLIATCKDNSGAFVCTNTPINGVSGGTSVADCNANVFSDMDGCNTHPAFNPQRISICTTDATSFNAGCIEATYAGTDAARLSFATACADISTTTDGCDTAFLNGVDGTTVDQCNANPFDTANDCATNSAFDARRMSVCTTGATSFNAGCVEATYTGTNDARISFAEACADAPGTMGCDTAYINGVDGTTVDACNANPFLTDCDTSGSFASAQTARNELCVATNDPFNALCEIEQFPTMNEANRDTYCQETALPAEGEAGGNCVGDRLTAICTTEATYNPFAPLCGTTNTAARMAFCGVNTQNPNCETVEATLCAANPFGTNLGPDADVNCVGGSSDYSSNRKDLADACRTNSEGTGCTDAINNCNANPFNPTAFSGGTCDQAAFADAQTAYCADPATTWQASCNAMAGKSTQNDITVARSGVCAANGAIMTGTVGDDVAAGESLFDARCTALTGETDLVTITNAQLAYCTDAENPWQGGCDRFGTGGADENADVETARNDVCLANGAIPSNSQSADPIAAGDSLFDALCGNVATIAAVREAECKTDAFAWHTGCQDLADDNSGDNDVAKARAGICFGDAELNRGGGVVIAEGESFFSNTCDSQVDSAGATIMSARLTHCEIDANAWHGENCQRFLISNRTVADARTRVCRANAELITGTINFDAEAGKSLFSSLCNGRVLSGGGASVADAREAYCTVGANIFDSQCGNADLYGGTNAARLAACAQDTAHESVGTNNCAGARANAICGDDDNAGSNPFAAICGVATQNINYFAELADSQQDYCRIADNNENDTDCGTVITDFCAPGGTDLTTAGIFDAICVGDAYNTAKNSYCSATDDATEGNVGRNCETIKVGICDGIENTDTPYSAVCDPDNNVAAQETFCGLTHETDPTGCAATRTTACADTDGNNPFNEDLCYEPGNTFDAQRTARADACRGDSPTRTGDECSAEVNACNVAPFGMHDGEDCSAVVYANARNAFCTVGDDIFDDNCGADGADTYGATTAARQAACESSDALPANIEDGDCNSRSALICGDATTEGSNAFATICSLATQNANHAVYEAAQDFFCAPLQGNQGNSSCTNITSVDWVESFTEGGGAALETDPTGSDVDLTRHNEFLAITGNTISTVGTATATSGTVAPDVFTLNFTEIKYNDNTTLTNLPAGNGLAFFTGYHGDDTQESAYVGIYETADLGGPITGRVTNATWSGALRILDGGEVFSRDFSLNVTFSGAAGFIDAFETNINTGGNGNSLKDFYIVASFDNKGVITTAVNFFYYGELNDDSSTYTASNGRVSGIIGQDGAIGVFVSNDTETDVYVGGFVASGVCSTNIFAEDCLVDDMAEEVAFCLNTTDNDGRNIFNAGCLEVETNGVLHGDAGVLTGLRNVACLARGDNVDASCKNRANVREACNTNVYAQTTGLTTNIELCTGMTADSGGVAYSTRQSQCEISAATFAQPWCDGGDTSIPAVDTARDTYCRDTATFGDTNCGSDNGNTDRMAEFCTESTGTSIFSAVCAATDTVTTAQTTACGGATTALSALGAELSDCNDDLLSGAICGDASSTPGSDPFAPICSESAAIISGFDKAAAQLAICSGPVSDLTDGAAVASDCNDALLSGAICGNAASAPGSNPFAEICSNNLAIISGFDIAMAQDTYCRDSQNASEGLSGGVCFTIKDTFCDGADATDNPYATLCVNNSVAQESFCENHRATNASLCTNSRATVCPDSPFTNNGNTNCFAGTVSYANQRADRCNKGTQGAGDCNTQPIVDAVCKATGDYANPFAAFCAVDSGVSAGVDEAALIQTVLSACPAGTNTDGVCKNTQTSRDELRGTTCVIGLPDNLFGTGCNYAEFKPLEVNYCETTGNEWLDRCQNDVTDVGNRIANARAIACIANRDINTGTVTTPVTVTDSLFKSVCSDLMIFNGSTVQSSRAAFCGGLIPALTGVGGSAALCTTYGLSATICGDAASVPGSNPFAKLCSEPDGIVSGFDLATAQRALVDGCNAKTITTGCDESITGASGGTLVSACIANPYITIDGCNGAAFLNVRNTRHALCGSDQDVGTNPFDVGCANNPDLVADQGTYCTTGNTNVFDSRCTETMHGEVAKARATACKSGNADFTGLSPISERCGDEETNDGNILYTYCQENAADDQPNCPNTFASLAAGECATNPWGTGGGTACDPTTYYSNRLAFCEGTGTFPSGVVMATVCQALAVLTCDTGGEGATVNPFNEICYDGADDYTSKRLARCRVDTAAQIAMLSSNRTCSGAGLSHVICGADANSAGDNPFAEICKTAGQNSNFANLDTAKQRLCGNDRLGSGVPNKGNCDTLQDNLCNTGAKSVSNDMRGAGLFVCRDDNGPNVIGLRNSFCEDPATTYTTGCTNAIGADGTNVLNARKTLAADCVVGGNKGASHADCIKPVNGISGLTVAQCSANPHQAACKEENLAAEFADVLTARDNLCTSSTSGSDPFNALCNVFPSRNAQLVDYCDAPTTAWETRCGTGITDTNNLIANARANVCINNQAIITTAGAAAEVADGMSLFNARCNDLRVVGGTTVADTRTALALTCRTTGGADGCNQPINGSSGTTVADCSANPYLTADSCNMNEAFNAERMARKSLCQAAATAFDQLCKNLDVGAADLSDLTERAAAQQSHCEANGRTTADAASGGNCESRNVAICGTASADGSSPFANLCGIATVFTDGQRRNCRTVLTAQQPRCAAVVVDFCIDGANNVFDLLCRVGYDSQRTTACVDRTAIDPTTSSRPASCGSENSVGDSYIKTYCAGNINSAAADNARDCPNTAYALKNPIVDTAVTADALAGRDGTANRALNATGTGLLTGADGTAATAFIAIATAKPGDPLANFMQDGTNDVNELELGGFGATRQDSVHLTLNSINVGNNNDTSGFAIARGEFSGVTDRLYVGLLHSTDLGAPLTANPADTTWDAQLQAIVNTAGTGGSTFGTVVAVPFVLDVSFTNKTIGTANDFSGTNLADLNINGKFTENGVIYGTVDINGNVINRGTLTGLIGQNGAVGIFKSNVNVEGSNTHQYVGGFVAAPTPPDVVNLADWTASFASGDLFPSGTDVATVPDGQTRFLEWDASGEFAQSGNNLDVGTNTLLLNDEANNGIGFHYSNSRGFAGLLSATDVGLPLDTVATATWSGTIAGVANGFAFSNTFALMVNYTKTSVDNAGTVTSAVREFNTTDDTKTISFGFNGTFNDAGVMIGTVSHVFDTPNSEVNRAGVFNGLIGQDGAVGVFKSNGAPLSPYVGGFVVKPPSGGGTIPPVQDEVDCTDELGATPFDEACMGDTEEDLQVRLCIEPALTRSNLVTDFTANCVDNDRVTNLVCTTSGLRANPFNAALCTDMNTGNTLTLKKSHSLISAPLIQI